MNTLHWLFVPAILGCCQVVRQAIVAYCSSEEGSSNSGSRVRQRQHLGALKRHKDRVVRLIRSQEIRELVSLGGKDSKIEEEKEKTETKKNTKKKPKEKEQIQEK